MGNSKFSFGLLDILWLVQQNHTNKLFTNIDNIGVIVDLQALSLTV